MTRTLTLPLLAIFLLALFAPVLVPSTAQADTLCYSNFECDTDAGYSCKELGTRAEGMGVCKKAGEAGGLFDNPLKAKSLTELLMSVLQGVVRIAGVFLVLAFVYVGFQFAVAQGNTEKLTKAREALLWTVVGAAILLGAEGIAVVIGSTASSLAP